MSNQNGYFNDINDVALEERNSKGLSGQQEGVPKHGSGPWVNSNADYSRSTDGNDVRVKKQQPARRVHILYAVICISVFAVGLGLGIVIGRYGIKQKNNNDKTTFPTQGERGMQFATSPITPPLTTVTPCKCPTSMPFTTQKMPSEQNCQKCPKRNPVEQVENENMSPFAPLSEYEMAYVLKILSLKGYASSSSVFASNRPAYMYLMITEKDKILDYLDKNKTFPGRYAKVLVVRGRHDDVMEYKVGPLNRNTSDVKIEPLRKDGEIHFNSRPYDSAEYPMINNVLSRHFRAINTLLQNSFDGATFPTTIRLNYGLMPSNDVNDRKSTVYLFLHAGGYSTVRILPVTCIIHHPGINTREWYASDFYYASQGPFKSGQELMDAYKAGTLRNITFPPYYRTLHQHELDLVRNNSEPIREYSDLPPPRTYVPKGARYSIKGHQVKWMDWEFDFTSNQMRGPAVFDVRFKKKRIAYEISLQDVTLLYSSQTNGAGPTVLSDTQFLLGNFNPPRLGLDCPDHGSILYASKFLYQSPKVIPAACVFEADGQKPLWRHKSSGLTDHHLILRVSMSLGNYDYAMDFKFQLDGSLETLLYASGFLFGATWDPDDPYLDDEKSATPFGYRILDYLIGPIHDHNYLFKIDLDIEGRNNSFETRHWRAGSTLEAFQSRANVTEKPGYFYFNNTRYVEYEMLENESSFLINPSQPKQWSVVNENERNIWGNIRGYRIIPYTSSAEILQDHTMLNAWDHLNFTFAVTKHKIAEEHGTTSWYDLQNPAHPFGGVGRMLNNENVRGEDLVVWMNHKFMHIPSAEDLPMTLSVPGGFVIKPYNYFDRTPVFDVQSHYDTNDPYTLEPCLES